jgi:2-hydroxychromene-2-carboxylate isomerase
LINPETRATIHPTNYNKKRVNPMTLSAELFWSFRSPYSYLATGQYCDLVREYDLEIKVRPVYPIAIRNPEFFDTINPMWIPYLMRDCKRIADFKGLTFKWPTPDPVSTDHELGKISDDQPYIRNITRLGVIASEKGDGLAFLDQVSRSIFDGSTVNWHLPETLARTVARAGFDLSELQSHVTGHESEIDNIIQENQDALEASGHWGVPTLVFENEPFFGQDRVDLAVWRMKQKSLQSR